jgi:hypothetical protein
LTKLVPNPKEAAMSAPVLTTPRPHADAAHKPVVRAITWTGRAVAVTVSTTLSVIFLGADMNT